MLKNPAVLLRSLGSNPLNNLMTVRSGFDAHPNRYRSVSDYRDLASTYDASCRRIGYIRSAAVNALVLQPGQTVFDVACGTGATLLELACRVGPRGRVIGIDHSPEMTAIARQRIAASDARNIELVVGPVDAVRITDHADALLFCFAHDVLQSAASLKNIFSMVRHDARVITVGAKLIDRWWAFPLNNWIRWRGQRYRTTDRGLARPWEPLRDYCPGIRVIETFHLGTSYLAEGVFSGNISAHSRMPHNT